MNDYFTDEELMAYADGELVAERVARLTALLPARPDLARRIDMFSRTRQAAAASMKVHLDEPVPHKVIAAVADMARDAARPGGGVVAWPVRTGPPRPAFSRNRWLPMAACIAMLVVGAIGYWLGARGNDQQSPDRIAGGVNAELAQVLSSIPSGQRSKLAHAQAEISLISSFRRGDKVLCREFEMSGADIGNHLMIACHSGAWSIDFSLRLGGGAGDSYRPASTVETLDAYLQALGAESVLESGAESDALKELRGQYE